MAVNAYSKQIREEIEVKVRQLSEEFSEDVARIRYSIDENWAGQVSIFLRVVLKAHAATPTRIRRVTRNIDRRITEIFDDLDDQGLHSFVYFRSETEPESETEPQWV